MNETFHPFIVKIEKENHPLFSVFKVWGVNKGNISTSKYEIVYLKSSYPTKEYDEVIYKIEGGVYLLLKSSFEQSKYDLECYFPAAKLNQIKIFLNSIIKKNDTTISSRD